MFKKPVTGREGMIGLEGKVIQSLDPEGIIKVKGELWKASSIGFAIKIEANEEVIVVGMEGLRLIVNRKKEERMFSSND